MAKDTLASMCTQLLTHHNIGFILNIEDPVVMRIAGIRELRARSADLLGGDEPVIVTKHGRVSGIYVPLEEDDRLPEDLGRKLAAVVGKHLAELLDRQGVTEKDLAKDFREHRRRRRC